MIIDFLAHHSNYVEDVSNMIYKEFVLNTNSSKTFDEVFTYFSNTNMNTFPITLIAIEGDECLGTISIFENDLKSREEYKPWLASLYTKPEHRNKGVGKQLIDGTLKVVKELGYKELFLRTETASDYYKNRGWHLVESVSDESGQNIDIFKYDLHNLNK
ncbi:GNAT family N-acetyltransferase [Heyndrickxia sporothermodurans]